MNTKIFVAAAVATLSLAGAAFAGEGAGDPFPFQAPVNVVSIGGPQRAILPENGQESTVQTVNALPAAAMDGTATALQSEQVSRWLIRQDDMRYAVTHQIRHNG